MNETIDINPKKQLLTAQNLNLTRGTFQLKDISFSVYSNEILAIIGKTGSGKTLLLESIAGFQKLDSGKILLREHSLEDYSLQERKLGYLYQEYCLFPHMTARENIAYGLKMQKRPKKEITKRVEALAEELEITSILNQYPDTLSGGEQQRVALARALSIEPELLLLDEPFSSLDPVTKQKLYRLIKKINTQHACTIVFVTHDFYEAQNLSDRTGVLINGCLRGIVDSDKLFTSNWDEDVNYFLGKREHHDQKRIV